MENNSQNYMNDTYELVKKYTDDKLLLLKIQSAKKISILFSKIIYIIITGILLFFVLMFTGFMLAYYFSEKYNNIFYGFQIVVFIYIGLLFLFMFLYKTLFSSKIKDLVSKLFFDNNSNYTDEDDEE